MNARDSRFLIRCVLFIDLLCYSLHSQKPADALQGIFDSILSTLQMGKEAKVRMW